jgi:hypothetical protein
MKRAFKNAILLICIFSGAVKGQIVLQQSSRVAPAPREAVPSLLDLFEQYSVVALSEGPHNNQKGHEFRLALVRDPRFGRLVNDVVVEFGNSRYQAVMDRYTAGEDVPYRELRQVWENTTIPGQLWDSPIYSEFFAAIRDVNRTMGSQIRVVLGDPPIDWASIRSADQINAYYPQRSSHAATVVQEEVLKRNRRALIVYGAGHIVSTGRIGANTLVEILKRDTKLRIFTISNSYPDVSRIEAGAAWPVPSLILVKGTTLGTAPSEADSPLEQDFDALLHLGGPSALSMTRVQKTVCDDAEYLKMRFERSALLATPSNPDPGAQLRQLCGLASVR